MKVGSVSVVQSVQIRAKTKKP